MHKSNTALATAVTISGVLLLLIGALVVISIMTVPVPPLWASAITMIVGLTLIWPSEPKLQIISGVGLFGAGTLIALRSLDILSQPWLQYGLGVFLILLGVITILYKMRQAKNGRTI